MQRTCEHHFKPLQVFTDTPARCIHLRDGHLDFDRPCNVVVRREARQVALPDAETRLAIRCAFGGQSNFTVDRRRYIVQDDRYLLFNLGQQASSFIDSPDTVESFNVTFQPEFADDVLRSITGEPEALLDEPRGIPVQPVSFLVHTYSHDDIVSPILFGLRERLGRGAAPTQWLHEQLHLLLERLYLRHGIVTREIQSVPAMRYSTRLELYQRLSLARTYMESACHESPTLDDCANVACLSPHHFLRLFKQVYRETPHQFLTRVRLERAHALLSGGDMSVTEVCFAIGFESLGSFSALYKRVYGVPPSSARGPLS